MRSGDTEESFGCVLRVRIADAATADVSQHGLMKREGLGMDGHMEHSEPISSSRPCPIHKRTRWSIFMYGGER